MRPTTGRCIAVGGQHFPALKARAFHTARNISITTPAVAVYDIYSRPTYSPRSCRDKSARLLQ